MALQIILTDRFRRDVLAITSERHSAIFTAILDIPIALKDPHRHAGIGLRKLHAKGHYEIRCGLDLRMIFELSAEVVYLQRIGTHNDVQRYLKSL